MATDYSGYMGRVLLIDLTTETAAEYTWSDRQRRETLGGKIMAYRILADHLTGNEPAFSEENWVILSTGPLTGTGAPGSVRFDITAVSPKTGLPTSSNCGGNFGLYLKKAGYDAVILSGRCKAHRWLEICEDQIRFHNADDLCGSGTTECRQKLTALLGKDAFGSLCIGPAGEALLPSATVICDDRAAGRAGLGAVLGWKNLKAITVTGNKPIPIYNKEKTIVENKKWFAALNAHPFTSDKEKVSSCVGCPIRCKTPGTGANEILNDLGIDSIAAAEGIQWLEKRIGFNPEFNPKHRDGQRRKGIYPAMLKAFGLQESLDTAMLYQDLTEAVSASGLCMFTANGCCPSLLIENPNSIAAKFLRKILRHSGWFVHFANRHPEILIFQIFHTRMLRSSTGMKLNLGDFLKIGKRSSDLEQYLNCKFNEKPKLPKHLRNADPEAYYKARGWDENGVPEIPSTNHQRKHLLSASTKDN